MQEELLLTILFRIPADDTNPESGLLLEEELFSAVVVAALVFLSLLFFFLILGVLLPSLVSRFWSSNDPVSVLVICLGEELGCKNPVDDDAGEGEDWGYAVSSSADVKIVGKIDGIMRELLRDSGRFTKL